MSEIFKQSGYLLASAFALGLSLHLAAAAYTCISAKDPEADEPARSCISRTVLGGLPQRFGI